MSMKVGSNSVSGLSDSSDIFVNIDVSYLGVTACNLARCMRTAGSMHNTPSVRQSQTVSLLQVSDSQCRTACLPDSESYTPGFADS